HRAPLATLFPYTTLFRSFWIILTLLTKGASALSFSLLTQPTPPPGGTGGLLNAIIGSVLMAVVATLVGTPIGVLAGTYLAEYGRSEEHTSELQSRENLVC